MIVNLLLLAILFLLNGLFAMSEMAIATSRKSRLQQLAENGNRRAAAAHSSVVQNRAQLRRRPFMPLPTCSVSLPVSERPFSALSSAQPWES